MPASILACAFQRIGLILFLVTVDPGAAIAAADTPAPPASPLNRLARQLAEKNAVKSPPAANELTRELLVRLEFLRRAGGKTVPTIARRTAKRSPLRHTAFHYA